MIPNSAWFPSSLNARVAWYGNFSGQFTLVAIQLGFVTADIDAVTADNTMMQFLGSAQSQLDAISASIRAFRRTVTEGSIGDPAPIWPPSIIASPSEDRPAGLFERLDNLVKRIRAAKTYTPEIGALLGIIPVKPDPIAPDELKPELSVVAMPGNIVQVHFKRGTTNGVDVQIQLDNDVVWNNQGRFVQSPAELNIPENPQGLPRAVQVRGRYFQGNTAVGLFSDVDVVATTP